MGRLRVGLSILAPALCFLVVHAGEKDFWTTKPYAEWSEKEVGRLLKNSPWSRSITLDFGMLGGEPRGSGGGARGGGAMPSGGGIEDIGGGGGGSRGRRGTPDGSSGPGTLQVLVTWYSLPIRQAMARSLALRYTEPPREALEKLLNYPEAPYFNILVIGGTGGARGDREEVTQKLRKETFLEKKDKARIALADLVLPSGPGQPLVLLFPKECNGKPSLTLEDKEVTLHTVVGQRGIRARFRLADMVVDGKPAL